MMVPSKDIECQIMTEFIPLQAKKCLNGILLQNVNNLSQIMTSGFDKPHGELFSSHCSAFLLGKG